MKFPYEKQAKTVTRKGIRYDVRRTRPTKFLGWFVMRGNKCISSRFKTREIAEDTLFGWQILGLDMEGVEVRRRFKSKTRKAYDVSCVQRG